MHSKLDFTHCYRNLRRFGTDKSVPYGKNGFVLQFQAVSVIASLRQQAWRSPDYFRTGSFGEIATPVCALARNDNWCVLIGKQPAKSKFERLY